MTTTKEFAWSVNGWNDKEFKYRIDIEFDDGGKVVDWTLFSNWNEGEENADGEFLEVDSYNEISEIFENSNLEKAHPNEFEWKDFHRWTPSNSGAGIIWKDTQQFLGVEGYYDSWNGTEWNDKVISDVNAYTAYSLVNSKSL